MLCMDNNLILNILSEADFIIVVQGETETFLILLKFITSISKTSS